MCDVVEIGDSLLDDIIEHLDGRLVVALPLGLGKPVALLDALYCRVKADPSLSMTILTALSLERPRESDSIRGRLLNPVFDRLYARYTEPLYLQDQARQQLPDHIQVREFYFKPGSRLGNRDAQRHYISANYTHAARDVAAQGCNLVMQLLAQDGDHSRQLSMSCNPDTSAELVGRLREEGRRFLHIGVIHPELPYMFGDAEVPCSQFDYLLREDPQQHGLFPVPRLPPIPDADYAIGIHASALVADGGTLQLGIGAMGDAIVQALMLRHCHNDDYRRLLQHFAIEQRYGQLVDQLGGREAFSEGLYGATEMFVEGMLQLFQAGVLRREVYDFWALQELINLDRCDPVAISADTVAAMAELGVRELRGKDFEQLQYHGYFNPQTRYHEGHLITPDGQHFAANMANPDSQQLIAKHCLGTALRNGKVMHGGFFLGSDDFYQALRQMPVDQRRRLAMCGVEKINQLDANPRLFRAQRRRARFINTGLNVSLNGAVASDTLDNGQVLSGVGGQYNFVAMAHQLPESRSVLMIRASRQDGGKAVSNILWHYASCTIPRHLRDIVISEYGIADLRSKTDEEVCQALINIADVRFQADLLAQAKAAGKLDSAWQPAETARNNTPQLIGQRVAACRALLPLYPLGCDFTALELKAAKALQAVAASSTGQKLQALLRSQAGHADAEADAEAIVKRLDLDQPRGLKLRLLARLLRAQLQR